MKRKYLFILLILIAVAAGTAYALFFTDKPAETAQKSQPKSTNTQKPEPKTQPEPTKIFDKTRFSIDDPASIWIVANKSRPLQPKNYAPTDLISVGNGQRMRAEAGQALNGMVQAAKTQGLIIKPLSGYRSYATQVSVYNNEVRTYGQATADTQSARPGTSEHQTGLAIDVGGGGCGIEDCFGNTAEGKWVADNAYKYGFIIRYTPDKVDVTGYRYEPWHVRYVGAELAAEMHNTNVKTLEEFFDLPAAPQYTN